MPRQGRQLGGFDAANAPGDQVRRRGLDARAGALAERRGLQPAVRRHGSGPLSRLRGLARAGSRAPQQADERLAVLAPCRHRHRPARPSALRQRPAQGHAFARSARQSAGGRGIHDAVPRPAGPQALESTRQQGVYAQGGQRARAPHPQPAWLTAGRHRRSRRLRPHEGGGSAAAGHRHRRDAGHTGGRPGAVQDLVGPARAYPGADYQRAGTRGLRSRVKGARCILPADHRGAPGGTAGRHLERARAGRGRRRPPDRARDAEHAAPAAHRRQRDHHQPHRQRLSGVAALPRSAPAAQGRSQPDPAGRG